MPIKDWSLYPPDWKHISHRIRFHRADSQCEWVDERDQRCEARHWAKHPITGSQVVLTVAHLNHDPSDNSETNLLALCQMHHLRYDADHHAASAALHRRQAQIAAGQLEFSLEFEEGELGGEVQNITGGATDG